MHGRGMGNKMQSTEMHDRGLEKRESGNTKAAKVGQGYRKRDPGFKRIQKLSQMRGWCIGNATEGATQGVEIIRNIHKCMAGVRETRFMRIQTRTNDYKRNRKCVAGTQETLFMIIPTNT